MTGRCAVGWRKPQKSSLPRAFEVSTQFKKGQSGNPKGRTKNTRNLKTDLMKILQQKIAVRDGDRKFKVSGQEGALMALMAKCLKGDTRTDVVAQRRHPAHPHALALGGGDFVSDPLARYLALELRV